MAILIVSYASSKQISRKIRIPRAPTESKVPVLFFFPIAQDACTRGGNVFQELKKLYGIVCEIEESSTGAWLVVVYLFHVACTPLRSSSNSLTPSILKPAFDTNARLAFGCQNSFVLIGFILRPDRSTLWQVCFECEYSSSFWGPQDGLSIWIEHIQTLPVHFCMAYC